MWCGHITRLSHNADTKNQKCHQTSHISWDFNNNPLLFHNDSVITLSFSNKTSSPLFLSWQLLDHALWEEGLLDDKKLLLAGMPD